MKEAIQGIYVDGIDEDTVFDRIEKARKKNGQYKVTEDDGRKIGFVDDEKEFDCNKQLPGQVVECNPVYEEEDRPCGPNEDEGCNYYDEPRNVERLAIRPLHES